MSDYIAIFSPFFHPEPISTGKYNTKLVRRIVERGCEVFVCCSVPLYPDWQPQKTFSSETSSNLSVFRGGAWLRYPASLVARRVLLELWYTTFALRICWKRRKTMQTCVAVFPPSLFFVLCHLVLPKHVRRIGIVHDLQSVLAKTRSGFFGRVLLKAIYSVEKSVFENCDKLIFLSDQMAEFAINEYKLPSNKIKVHYPFVSNEFTVNHADHLAVFFPDGYVHVVYSGALGEKQAPDELLQFYVDVVNSREDVVCHLFSRGPIFNDLRSAVCHDRIRFHDLVDESDLCELYQRSSIQILPQLRGSSQGALPSKLPNLLAAGVPVFALADMDSEIVKILHECGCGCGASEWEAPDLVQTFLQFLESENSTTHAARSIKVEAYLKRKFNLDNVVNEILVK